MTTLYAAVIRPRSAPAARTIGAIRADLWRAIALLNDGHVAGEPGPLYRLQDRAEELVELWAIRPATDCERRDAEEIIARIRECQETS